MKLSNKEKRELLQKAFWDTNMNMDYLLSLLEGGPERFPGDRTNLYLRLLRAHHWYTLIRLIPTERLRDEALSEAVVSRLFPKELREKYEYARAVLSE